MKTVGVKYGFAPSPDWLEHVRLSSLRIAGGCSASFISPQGLVMTNHHCVVDCRWNRSRRRSRNFRRNQFIPRNQRPPRSASAPISNSTNWSKFATSPKKFRPLRPGKTGDEANRRALRALKRLSSSKAAAQAIQSVRCDVVYRLYHGGVYDLYHYKRYNDVRLVFAPEFSVAQFGGDPNNFNFPRFDFDIGVLRAYEADKPAATKDYLHWSANGSKDGDLEILSISGNPGGTFRELTSNTTVAFEAATLLYPNRIPEISERRGELEAFIARGPQRGRAAVMTCSSWKTVSRFTLAGSRRLLDPATVLWEARCKKSRSCARPPLRTRRLAAYVSAWDDIEHISTCALTQLFVRATELSDRIAFRGALPRECLSPWFGRLRSTPSPTPNGCTQFTESRPWSQWSSSWPLLRPSTPIWKSLTLRSYFRTIIHAATWERTTPSSGKCWARSRRSNWRTAW